MSKNLKNMMRMILFSFFCVILSLGASHSSNKKDPPLAGKGMPGNATDWSKVEFNKDGKLGDALKKINEQYPISIQPMSGNSSYGAGYQEDKGELKKEMDDYWSGKNPGHYRDEEDQL